MRELNTLLNNFNIARAHLMSEEGGGGGGGGEIPQPLIVSLEGGAQPMFKNLDAATAWLAMHLFINTNFDSANGISSKSPSQAAADAVVRAKALVDAAGDIISTLCSEE